jgi:16S rRNA (cytidine1402-2'-O)-methyltransferase
VYFESPFRLLKTLEDSLEVLPLRDVCVARELTKKFEEVKTGKPQEVLAHFRAQRVRGEITFVVQGSGDKKSKILEAEAEEDSEA